MLKLGERTVNQRKCRVAILITSLFLVGCEINDSDVRNLFATEPQINKEIDYSKASCNSIWAVRSFEAYMSSNYWLGVMFCAQKLDPREVSGLLSVNSGKAWYSMFRKAIILGQFEDTKSRKQLESIMKELRTQCVGLPQATCQLIILWMSTKTSRQLLLDEKEKHTQSLLRFKEQEKELSENLRATEMKLQSLTEIERQLSFRKAGG